MKDTDVLWLANEYIKTDKTIRQLAEIANVSKSLVYKMLQSEKLQKMKPELYELVQEKMKEKRKSGQRKGGHSTQVNWWGNKKSEG